MSRRDDFTKKTVELLSRRAGGRCSMCNCPTWGPNDSPYSATNIGQAAHIAAAAEGGPRYDPSMSSEERTSVKNGIWLCSNCHDKIDRNVASYNTKTLHQLKKSAENRAREELGVSQKQEKTANDPLLQATVSGVAIMKLRKLKSKLSDHHQKRKLSDKEAIQFLSSLDFLDFGSPTGCHGYLPEVGTETISYLCRLLGYIDSAPAHLEAIRYFSETVAIFPLSKEGVVDICESIKFLMKGHTPRDPVYQSSMALLKNIAQKLSKDADTCKVIKDTMVMVARQQTDRHGRRGRGGHEEVDYNVDDHEQLSKRSRLENSDDQEVEQEVDVYLTNMLLLAGNEYGCHDNIRIEEEIDKLGFESNIL